MCYHRSLALSGIGVKQKNVRLFWPVKICRFRLSKNPTRKVYPLEAGCPRCSRSALRPARCSLNRHNSRSAVLTAREVVGCRCDVVGARFTLRPDFASGAIVNWLLYWLGFSGRAGRCALRQAGRGGSSAANSGEISGWRGHEAGSVMTIRVFFSTIVAASFTRFRRRVSICVCRQGDRFGQVALNMRASGRSCVRSG